MLSLRQKVQRKFQYSSYGKETGWWNITYFRELKKMKSFNSINSISTNTLRYYSIPKSTLKKRKRNSEQGVFSLVNENRQYMIALNVVKSCTKGENRVLW